MGKKKHRHPRRFPCGPGNCEKLPASALHKIRNQLQIVMAEGAENKKITEAVHAIAELLPSHGPGFLK